jgi:glycosyltransferase involved in cell wall biosynthesis
MVVNIAPKPYVAAALAQYEVSTAMRARVEERFSGDVVYLSVAELKRRSLKGMLCRLRSLKVTNVVVVAEDEGALQAAAILKPLAAMIPAQEYFMLRWDGRLEPFSRTAQAVTLLRIGIASLRAVTEMKRIRAKSERLEATPRIVPRPAGSQGTIAFINGNLSFGLMAGGSVGHIAGVANAFADAGLTVKYFGSTSVSMLRRVEHIPLKLKHSIALPPEINQYIFGQEIVSQVRDAIENDGCCFVYQRLSLGNFSGVELSRELNVPLIVEYNGSEIWATNHWGTRVRYDKAARGAEELMLRHAHLVVTISAPLRDELLSRGIEPDRIVLYPNCIDPLIFDPLRFSREQTGTVRDQLGVPEDACVVMFVGTFGLWHGAEVLAKAILALVEREQAALEASKVVFVFVGTGVTLPKVRAMLSAPLAAGFVRFAGLVPQDQAPAYLAAADICVSPHVDNPDGSRFFGSPTKLFEYMAMAKPIVASKLEQIGEVLSPAISVADIDCDASIRAHPDAMAILTTPGRADELARAILFLVSAPDWRRHLGENVRAEALAKYTWRAHVGAILERIATITV